MDVNGSVRPYVESLGPSLYVGTDMREGPGVDWVLLAEYLPSSFGTNADVVISTEMLEHAQDWQAAMRGMIGALAPGGVLVLTTRSAGFPLHGYPDDHNRFSVQAMGEILRAAGLDAERLEADPQAGHPGVFARARKPRGWTWPEDAQQAWDEAEVTRP
jgi:SAM-dependent methyltransferase